MSLSSKFLGYVVGGCVVGTGITYCYCYFVSKWKEEPNEPSQQILHSYRNPNKADTHVLVPFYIEVPKHTISCIRFKTHQFLLPIQSSVYSKATVVDLLTTAAILLDEKLHPAIYQPDSEWMGQNRWHFRYKEYIRDFDSFALKLGIQIRFKLSLYQHATSNNAITCPHLLKSSNPLHPSNCPIYSELKLYVFTEKHLNHLHQHSHFNDEHSHKPLCKHGNQCKAYKRLQNGPVTYQLEDRCHAKMYRHPPRSDFINLQQNTVAFQYTDQQKKANLLCNDQDEKQPTVRPDKWMEYAQQLNDCFVHKLNQQRPKPLVHRVQNETQSQQRLQRLISEVVRNGFEKDLCLDKVHDFKRKEYTLMSVVKDKMNHARHQRYGRPLQECHMLALILYTGCDCNANLCLSQRNGDFEKWKEFDQCLSEAIERLSKCEDGEYKVYSGACGIQLDRKRIKSGYFKTYTSTSWNRRIAEMFVGGDGVIFEMDAEFRRNSVCCDVSWISLFDEAEILFSRHTPMEQCFDFKNKDLLYRRSGFNCHVIDDSNGIQTVVLQYQKKQLSLMSLCHMMDAENVLPPQLNNAIQESIGRIEHITSSIDNE